MSQDYFRGPNALSKTRTFLRIGADWYMAALRTRYWCYFWELANGDYPLEVAAY